MGRDCENIYPGAVDRVSIHAPAWGATKWPSLFTANRWSFNPRALMGRDHKRFTEGVGCQGFNPRARMGRDGER